MNEIITSEEIKVENLIYEIDGKQVMLDIDLAKLYGTETKRIKEAVARNKEKFPERYCFKISEKECNSLKSHYATSKGGSRKGHRVFFHDRFIIIDRKVLYNCGLSFKDLGKSVLQSMKWSLLIL